MRTPTVLLVAVLAAGCASVPTLSDPASDAPEVRRSADPPATFYPSYAEALAAWRRPADVNAWIGAAFEYDFDRAVALSESQRANKSGPKIIEPNMFYARPKGVCVDLARFAVETLNQLNPVLEARYLMIEFNPTLLRGQVLRRHWVVTFKTEDGVMVMADSKRPGVISGPYQSTADFLTEYAVYRGREVVSFRETDSYARTTKMQAKRTKSDS
jgi:hypothetical protein